MTRAKNKNITKCYARSLTSSMPAITKYDLFRSALSCWMMSAQTPIHKLLWPCLSPPELISLPSQPELSSYCDLIRRGCDRTCRMRRAFSLCSPTNRRISLNPEQFADMKIETQFQRTQKKCQISCGKSRKIWTMARCSCTGSWFANHISEAESYQRGRFSVVFWKAWFLQTIILNKTTEFDLKKMWARSPNQNLHQL